MVHRLITSCTPSLCGKSLSQNVTLYTISTISLWGKALNGNWFTIAHIHSLNVPIIYSIAGTCSFWPVMLMVMPVSEKCFLMCSNCPSPCRFWTVKLHLWYICLTCLMAMTIVMDFSFHISSAVQKCMDHNVVMTKEISFMYMMSASSVTLPCLSIISVGSSCIVVTT